MESQGCLFFLLINFRKKDSLLSFPNNDTVLMTIPANIFNFGFIGLGIDDDDYDDHDDKSEKEDADPGDSYNVYDNDDNYRNDNIKQDEKSFYEAENNADDSDADADQFKESLSYSYSFVAILSFILFVFFGILLVICGGWHRLRHVLIVTFQKSAGSRVSWAGNGYQPVSGHAWNSKDA